MKKLLLSALLLSTALPSPAQDPPVGSPQGKVSDRQEGKISGEPIEAVITEENGDFTPPGNLSPTEKAQRRLTIIQGFNDIKRIAPPDQIVTQLMNRFNLTPEEKAFIVERIGNAREKLNGTILPPDGGQTPANPIPVRPNTPVPGWQGTQTPLLDLARQTVSEQPRNPDVLAGAAKANFVSGDYRAAFDQYGKAIDLGAKEPGIYVGYGVSAYQLKDYALAQQAAKIVLSANPKDKDALTLYYASKGRAPAMSLPSVLGAGGEGVTPEALAAAGAPPPQQVAGVGVGAWRPGRTPEQALAEARAQAAAAGPGAAARSAAITKDAASALRQRDYPTAHNLATQAIVLNNANAQALNFRAMASSKMRNYTDAVADASAALALVPGNTAVLQTRSWAFAKQGKYQEALKDAEDTLARDPSNPYAYQNKAMALAGMHDREGAIDALRRSAALDPRFQNQLERALQLPQDADLGILFDDTAAPAAAAAAPIPVPTGRRFARLAILSAMGGILIALAILHVVSAGWREKVNGTIRRVLASSDAEGSEAPVATPMPSNPGAGAFWLQYQLVKEIGLGGMGVVYEAIDRSLERRVAVKKMRDEIRVDPHERRRFVNEAKLVAQLRHPNIVDIYAIVEEGDEVYLVFEYVTGRTLADTIKGDGPMSPEAARGVLAAAASAVENAHAAQIVHRDLKPSNIMITEDGRVKVMDFGVARQAKEALTKMSQTNTVVGTPPYMAPEQEQGTVRKESDVFALGVCLYEMLTGQLPFQGGGAAMLLNKINGKHIPPSQRNPALPGGLDAVLAKALEPDPEKRYRTPSELIRAIDGVLKARA